MLGFAMRSREMLAIPSNVEGYSRAVSSARPTRRFSMPAAVVT